MNNLEINSRPVKIKEIVYASMQPDIVFLNLDNGYYYSTNEIGAAIWELCDGKKTIENIVSDICNNYDTPSAEVKFDVEQLINDMLKEGLLKIQND